MNIFNKFFLYLVLLPSAFYKKIGVHLPHLRSILRAKLMMDDRRVNSMQQVKNKKGTKPPKFATLGTMFITALLGCFFLVSFYVGNDYLTRLTVYFSLYIFTLTSVLIADFTSVLIDVRDNMIILPKPINDKTFVLARLLHIVIHVSKMVMPMALPATIWLGMHEGLRGVAPFILMNISATLFTIFLINAIYLFILKITTAEKFKNIIGYFQIFVSVVFYASYQLVPRLIGKSAMDKYSIAGFKYAWAAVPYWFAAGWQYFQDLRLHSNLLVYFILTLVLPFASIWVVIKYFAPSFNRKLSMISGSEEGAAPAARGRKKITSTTSRYISQISKWLTDKGAERMSFLNTWKITGRSRDFKMKVYPAIGYLAVYIVIILMKDGRPAEVTQNTKALSILFLGIVYFSSFVLMMAIGQIGFSDKYKASWIYFITPIAAPGKLLSGALKATFVKFYLPMVIGTFVLAMLSVGPSILPNLILGVTNQVLIITLISFITMRHLPFSTQQSISVKGGSFLRGLISMIIPACIAVGHFFVYQYMVVVLILCILSAIAAWMTMDSLKKKSWDKLAIRQYEE